MVNSTAFKTIKEYVKRGLDWYNRLSIWVKMLMQFINGQLIDIHNTFESNFKTFEMVNSNAFLTIKYCLRRGYNLYYWLSIWVKIMIQLING